MSWITFLVLLASGTALVLSIGACTVAFRLWRQFPSTPSGKLLERLTELELMQEELSAEQRRFRSARNMAAHRGRKAARESLEMETPAVDSDDPGANARAELNNLLAQRQLKGP